MEESPRKDSGCMKKALCDHRAVGSTAFSGRGCDRHRLGVKREGAKVRPSTESETVTYSEASARNWMAGARTAQLMWKTSCCG